MKEKSIELIKAYKRLFATDDGKEVLQDLKINGYFYHGTGVDDDHHSPIAEGKRRLMLHIYNHIETDLDKLQEKLKKKKEEDDLYEDEGIY